MFSDYNLDSHSTYILLRLITVDTYLKAFQYKILNNELYLNKKLFQFRICVTLCSRTTTKHPYTLFCGCEIVNTGWKELNQYFKGLSCQSHTVKSTDYHILSFWYGR